MLTEKELENDDSNEIFENYILEVKIKNEKNEDIIRNLVEKIETLEISKNDNKLDEMVQEFEDQKEKYKKKISFYIKLEQELTHQVEEKDEKFHKLNEELQNIQFENLHLVNQSDIQGLNK